MQTNPKGLFRRALIVAIVVECALVASYAAADTPLPVPVDGLSHATSLPEHR